MHFVPDYASKLLKYSPECNMQTGIKISVNESLKLKVMLRIESETLIFIAMKNKTFMLLWG